MSINSPVPLRGAVLAVANEIEPPKPPVSLFGEVKFEPVERRMVITVDCKLKDQTHVRAVEGAIAKALSVLGEIGTVSHHVEPVEITGTVEPQS